MMSSILDFLLLILVANGAPVLLSYVLSHHVSFPVDFGLRLNDQQYLLGRTKTWRGIVVSLLATGLVAIILDYEASTGVMIAVLAMSGDLISSFIKRRLKKTESSQAFLLDQIPESLFPSLWLMKLNYIDLTQVMVIVVCFIIIELVLSVILYKIGIRKQPY